MLTVAALTVLGRDDYLRRHLQGALHVGVTPAEIKEILMQMAFYGGMPVALKALRIAQEEITAWEAAAGRAAGPEPGGRPLPPPRAPGDDGEEGARQRDRGGQDAEAAEAVAGHEPAAERRRAEPARRSTS